MLSDPTQPLGPLQQSITSVKNIFIMQ